MPNPIITITGNLAEDPELRFTPSGKAVANFRVLTSDSERLPDGSWGESKNVTGWDCAVWNQAAENVAESLQRGSAVVITGKVYDEQWEDRQTGQKRSKKKVDVFKVGLDLGRGPARQEQAQRTRPQPDGYGNGGTTRPDDPWAAPNNQQQPPASSRDPWGPPAADDEPPF